MKQPLGPTNKFPFGKPLEEGDKGGLVSKFGVNANYSLKGRTLSSIAKHTNLWHKELQKVKDIKHAQWEGVDLEDFKYIDEENEPPHKRVIWTISQIKTGRELAAEGSAMRHCVYSYDRRAAQKECSIWSMKSFSGLQGLRRNLTIELNREFRVVQARGLANRAAKSDELAILRRWAISSKVKYIST